jgi:hypothetical protein
MGRVPSPPVATLEVEHLSVGAIDSDPSPAADLSTVDSQEAVIAGLDPAIHLLRKRLFRENGWTRGSSYRDAFGTKESLAPGFRTT